MCIFADIKKQLQKAQEKFAEYEDRLLKTLATGTSMQRLILTPLSCT